MQHSVCLVGVLERDPFTTCDPESGRQEVAFRLCVQEAVQGKLCWRTYTTKHGEEKGALA